MSEPKIPGASPSNATEAYEQALAQPDTGRYVLRLYVAGVSPQSLRDNIQALCAEHLQGRFELEIIDIYQQPIFAKEGQIVAAPTLVKELPRRCGNSLATFPRRRSCWPGWRCGEKPSRRSRAPSATHADAGAASECGARSAWGAGVRRSVARRAGLLHGLIAWPLAEQTLP